MAMVNLKLNTKHVCRRSLKFFLSGLSSIFKDCCFEMKRLKKAIFHYVLYEINCLGLGVGFCLGFFVLVCWLKFVL